MKNTLKKIALALFASVFMFSGCTQLTDPVNVYNGNGNNEEKNVGETTNLTINVSSSENIIKFAKASTARTILPSAIDGTAEGSVFYIWGTNTITGIDFGPEVIEFNATPDTGGTKGTVKKLFSRSAYELNLAYVSPANTSKITDVSKTNIIKYASLTANTDVDLRYNEKVYFYLTPNTDGTAQSGSLSLKVNALGWDPADAEFTGYTMTTSLQNVADDSTIASSDKIKGDIGPSSTLLPTTEPGTANYVLTGVPAGTYEFVVTFSRNGRTYTTSEDVIILANEPTVGSFKVLDIIEKVPTAPSNFVATYKDPETNLNDATFYNVALTWDATGIKNENYFELETLEILDSYDSETPFAAKDIDSDSKWSDAINDTYDPANVTRTIWSNQERSTTIETGSTTSHLWGESNVCTIYEGGNLKRNSQQVIMQLPLGSRYFARIRAVNDAGESAWTYLDLDGGTAEGGYKAFTEDDYYINRFQVRYNLNGGVKEDGDLELNKFYTYNGTEIEIPVARTSADDTTLPLVITKGVDPNKDYWQKWTKTDGTDYTNTSATPVTNPAYTGYKDLVLVANYDAVSNMDVEMIHPSDFEIKDDAIGIAFDGAATESEGKYVVDLNVVTKIVLSFNTAVKYSKIEYEIKQANGTSEPRVYEASLIGSGTYTNEYVIDITGWKTGNYLITWKAWHASQGNYPYTNCKLVEIESSATN